MDLHRKLHVGVVQATKFRALTAIRANLTGVQAQHIGPTGNGIHLAPQARYPEGMDDVGGGQVDINRHIHWHMQFVTQDDTRAGIADLPPPLIAGNFYHQRFTLFRRQRQHVVANGNTES
jgi:hypothetical protein